MNLEQTCRTNEFLHSKAVKLKIRVSKHNFVVALSAQASELLTVKVGGCIKLGAFIIKNQRRRSCANRLICLHYFFEHNFGNIDSTGEREEGMNGMKRENIEQKKYVQIG